MSNDFFKVKKGLNIKPVDPSTLTNSKDGDIIIDSTDGNQIKLYDSVAEEFSIISTPIPENNYAITNNQSSPLDLDGLLFDGAVTKAAKLSYAIQRSTGTTELSQIGELKIIYKTNAGSWSITDSYGGDNSGVTFSITNLGQIQYTSTEILGSNYQSALEFHTTETFKLIPVTVPTSVESWSQTLKDSEVTLSNSDYTALGPSFAGSRIAYQNLTTAGTGTYGTAKLYLEFIQDVIGTDDQFSRVGFNFITNGQVPANFTSNDGRGDASFSLKVTNGTGPNSGSSTIVVRDFNNSFNTIGSFPVLTNGDVVGIALDTSTEQVEVFINGVSQGAPQSYNITGFDYTGQDIYGTAALGFTSQTTIEQSPTVPSGFTAI